MAGRCTSYFSLFITQISWFDTDLKIILCLQIYSYFPMMVRVDRTKVNIYLNSINYINFTASVFGLDSSFYAILKNTITVDLSCVCLVFSYTFYTKFIYI